MAQKIAFSKPTLGKEEDEAVLRVMHSHWLAAGPETEAFEKEFASYVGVKYAIFTNSGTSALKMAWKYFYEDGYKLYNLLTPNTFCATYSSAEEIGLRPSKRGLRIATHYGGVKSLEKDLDIEDSAHRIEKKDPLTGKIRCYSFYITKNMTTSTGGMLVTNEKYIYERCRLYWKDGLLTTTGDRVNGKWDCKVKVMAGGYDGDDLRAAIGRVQLKKLPEFTRRRNEIRDRYNQAFNTNFTGNHLWVLEMRSISRIKKFLKFMKDKGVICGWHYPGTGWTKVSLPIYPLLKDSEVEYIILKVKEWK